MIKKGRFEVPDNIILVKSAPQIDILKKASLLITHGGMNSASESMHFGGRLSIKNLKFFTIKPFIFLNKKVPMVFIPIYADQPMVAKRIADELGLGIRLETETLTYEKIRNAAHTVLNNIIMSL